VVSVPLANVLVGLIVLAGAVLPLGLVLLRVGERFIGRKISFSVPERALLALYAAGGLLFLVASVPSPLFDLPTVVGLLVLGAAAYTALAIRERGAGARALLAFLRSIPGLLLIGLTVGLLAIELVGVANLRLSNGLDGSVYSLFVNLLLTNHTVPWTLSPYASVGVTYPQAASVWLSLPVLLFGWPIVSAPLVVPALFLSLSVVAAYSLGTRLTEGTARNKVLTGLLFAGFFTTVASWPRLFVAGSYDFAICLPLFLLILGWLAPFVGSPLRPWKEVVAFGAVVAIATSLNAMVGLTIGLLILGYLIVFRAAARASIVQWVPRWLAICGLAILSVFRSIVAVVVWFNYPGHVLTPVGNPPPATIYVNSTISYRFLTGSLDPFILFKEKLSPFAWQSVELAVLLAAGLGLLIWSEVRPGGPLSRHLSKTMTRPVLVGAIVVFAETLGASVAGAINNSASGPQSLLNINEISILLFIFYELIAVLPLVVGLSMLRRLLNHSTPHNRPVEPVRGNNPRPPADRKQTRRIRLGGLLACALLVVPLASGAVGTVAEVPAFINYHTTQEANISQGDMNALAWVGSHLPPCSNVLVAPGSVGQYLPEFAKVNIVFPAFPTPANLSYQLIVQDLQAGNYSNSTRAEMMDLGITEVFVSGQTSVTYLPFMLPPLERSSDFSALYSSGDAAVLEFTPGAGIEDCSP
jgi:hypothetical protein